MKIIIVALLLYPMLSMSDDRDLYFSSVSDLPSQSETMPNILFVIDTSDSMNDPAPNTRTDTYNKNYKYSPSSAGYFTSGQRFALLDTADDPTTYTITWKIACNLIQKTVADNGIYEGPAEIDPLTNYVLCGNALSKNYRVANSNYLNWMQVGGSGAGDRYKLDIIKEEFVNLISNLNGVNISIMSFDTGNPAVLGKNGGAVILEMQPVEQARASAISLVKGLSARSYTPISETMMEATRYLKGMEPLYGAGIYKGIITLKSVGGSLNGSVYKTPITSACQLNHIVLFTDGIPSTDIDAAAEINSNYDAMLNSNKSLPPLFSTYKCDANKDGACLDELTYYLRNGDLSDIDGSQYATTHTIGGFMPGEQTVYLQDAANAGGGKFFNANDSVQLASALNEIMVIAKSQDGMFTAPAVSASSSNRLTHNDAVYMAMFKPVANMQWPGNLKKYRLGSDGLLYGQNSTVPVIDTSTGMFRDGAYDLWNKEGGPDGNKAPAGGAASVIVRQPVRDVYFNTESGATGSVNSIDVSSNDNLFNVDKDLAGKLKSWVSGVDIVDANKNGSTSDPRHPIADPLHSEPKIVKYESGVSLVFFGDNEGYLHAIDADTGEERYAFIPRELLAVQSFFMEGDGSYKDKPYGLDGLISVRDYSGVKTLYVGMRRGGRNYYSLDITASDTARVGFVIRGGVGDYKRLGQTWAKAVPAKVRINNEVVPILIINGGYDPVNESSQEWAHEKMGDAIYIVNAETGERLWWASNSGADFNIDAMVNSIPSSASPVDINADGFVDYFYSSDIGGHIFRVDIKQNATSVKDMASVRLIASLGGDTRNGGMIGAENNRKFYTSPSVSYWPDSMNGDFISLALGSGLRELPKNKNIQDNFYVIRDRFPFPTRQPTGSETDTARIHHKNIIQGDDDFVNIGLPENQLDSQHLKYPMAIEEKNKLVTKLNSSTGWYFPLDKSDGEKVVSDAVTFDGSVFFSSFAVSSANNQAACGVDLGRSQFYALDLLMGSATIDLDGDGVITEKDRKKDLKAAGLTPRPVVIFRDGNKKSIVSGTEAFEDTRFDDNDNNDDGQGPGAGDRNGSLLKKMYWREKM